METGLTGLDDYQLDGLGKRTLIGAVLASGSHSHHRATAAYPLSARGEPDGGGDVSGDGWPTGPAPTCF